MFDTVVFTWNMSMMVLVYASSLLIYFMTSLLSILAPGGRAMLSEMHRELSHQWLCQLD